MISDVLEIYEEDKRVPFVRISSGFQPSEGDLINIRTVTWLVLGRSFTVDKAGDVDQSIRCNVIVVETSTTPADR
jgi:hypothetical protein